MQSQRLRSSRCREWPPRRSTRAWGLANAEIHGIGPRALLFSLEQVEVAFNALTFLPEQVEVAF